MKSHKEIVRAHYTKVSYSGVPVNLEKISQLEQEKFTELLSNVRDPLSALLRTHLIIEQYLERIIRAKLKSPEKLLSKGRLTFNQKLLLVSSFCVLDDKTYYSVKYLNEIRNDCVHKVEEELDQEKVEKLGNTLRPWFTDLKNENPEDYEKWLGHVLPLLAGRVNGATMLEGRN